MVEQFKGQALEQPKQLTHIPEKIVQDYDKEVNEIFDLQTSWPEFVVPLERQEIQELINQGLMSFNKSESSGKILATLYRKPLYELPLDDPKQVFKIGGLATLKKWREFDKSVEALKKLIDETAKNILKQDLSVIMCTGNEKIADILISLGCTEYSAEEFKKEFPDLFSTFMASETKPLGKETIYFRPGRGTIH